MLAGTCVNALRDDVLAGASRLDLGVDAACGPRAGGRRCAGSDSGLGSLSRSARFDCATARVPLDNRNAGGSTIGLAVIRHQAEESARRVGTLSLNRGGPGQVKPGFEAAGRAKSGVAV